MDDDARLVTSLKDFLQLHGFQVGVASNGMMAKVVVAAQKPALVILDVDMPMMNGLQALDVLRALPGMQALPVILMTGVASAQVSPSLEGKPRVSHVKKPVEPADLLSIIRHYIPESV